ncbi:unnamed protein product [Staurois parvus]|uniref:Uncharacterized protein n=1 Tax=Staurois parvus TaxID=386267 RepID=A0ABN9GHA8_9NEOB|nr:unnamed protein product [Staurois parvus]
MGPYTASSCCCQVQSLSWVPVRPPIAAVSIAHTLPCATFRSPLTLLVCSIFCHRVLADYGPPIAAARPLICHGPPLPPPHAAARSRVSHGSTASHCCCLMHTLPCATFRSPHTAGVFHFLT